MLNWFKNGKRKADKEQMTDEEYRRQYGWNFFDPEDQPKRGDYPWLQQNQNDLSDI
jgi:phosphodiesterase/alkaline phosphatase D-like protein